jgi:3-hydroxy-9,10-secoandrosta-1,3,5(10)-triene-9,17-dione monooxygenase reductase component
MRQLDHFCVNVLADDQEELAMRFARSGTDKWTGTDWLPDIHGQPALTGAIATVSCLSHAEFGAGDHIIKVGHVRAIKHDSSRLPLLYFRSQFSRLQIEALQT